MYIISKFSLEQKKANATFSIHRKVLYSKEPQIVEIFRVLLTFFEVLCGASRDRTDDLLLAKQMLSQLSYSPKKRCMKFITLNLNIQHICPRKLQN